MIFNWLFKSPQDKVLNQAEKLVKQINDLELSYQQLKDSEFPNLMQKWKKQVQERGLDSLLPDVFAAVREAVVRCLGKRIYDVQLIGGIVLHKGMIAEAKTGEGKTIMMIPPAILNSISGKVHVVTINDYLVHRDATDMAPVYEFFGLKIGYIIDNSTDEDKREVRNQDITYYSNLRLIFDYLESNTVSDYDDKYIFPHLMNYVIVDEIDYVKIDEAKTPCIIASQDKDASDLFNIINPVIKSLVEDVHYTVDLKNQNVYLNSFGSELIEKFLLDKQLIEGSLFSTQNVYIYHICYQLLKAHRVMLRNKDYVVSNGEILLIDKKRGRVTPGRRFTEWLHQALEAKEGLNIKSGSKTKASITQTNFFRLYEKKAGTTGTAMSHKDEFAEVHNLQVIQIPTNKPVIRKDNYWSVMPPELNQEGFYDLTELNIVSIIEWIKFYMPEEINNPELEEINSHYKFRKNKKNFCEELILESDELDKLAEILEKNNITYAPKYKSSISIKINKNNNGFFSRSFNKNIEEKNKLRLKVDLKEKEEKNKIRMYHRQQDLHNDAIEIIKQRHYQGQPILVCCNSVSESELFSSLLNEAGLVHALLNATNNEKEAYIIAQAGRPGRITVTTAMSGRGTDIFLGGNVEMLVKQLTEENNYNSEEAYKFIQSRVEKDREFVKKAGGMLVFVLHGTSSYEALMQFFGRAGRQGDEGMSLVMVSIEDEIFKTLLKDPMMKLMFEYYFPPENKFTCSEKAWDILLEVQKNQQINDFESRKQLLLYDDIVNDQRKNIYKIRDYFLTEKALEKVVQLMLNYIRKNIDNDKIILYEKIIKNIKETNEELLEIILNHLDNLWQNSLVELENLKKTTYLAFYEQRDPIQQYREKAYELFLQLLHQLCVLVFETLEKNQENQKEEDIFNFQSSTSIFDEIKNLMDENFPKKLDDFMENFNIKELLFNNLKKIKPQNMIKPKLKKNQKIKLVPMFPKKEGNKKLKPPKDS